MVDNETLIDVEIHDGQLVKKVARKDGTIDYVPIEEKKSKRSITEAFEGTDTIPQSWTPPTTENVLSPKHPMTREQHVDRSCKVEAVLIKAFSSSTKATQTLDTRGNTALKELLVDLCLIMGGHWAERAKDIK